MGCGFLCTILLWCADIAMLVAAATVGWPSGPLYPWVYWIEGMLAIFTIPGCIITCFLCGALFSREDDMGLFSQGRNPYEEEGKNWEGRNNPTTTIHHPSSLINNPTIDHPPVRGDAGGEMDIELDIELAERGMVNSMYGGGGAAAASEKKCPQGHDLTPHTTEGGRGTCDGCSRSLYHGTQVMQCFQCDFFICRSCSSKIDASETTAAERQAADNALTAIDQRQAAMRGRRVRKEDSLINAAAAEEKERQVRVKGMLVHV